MLGKSGSDRSFINNLLLGCSTALTAGMTNTAGVMACYAYTANVTGHGSSFAQHMLAGNFFEMFIVLGWMLSFLIGAGIAHFLIRSFEYKGPFIAHSIPILLELLFLLWIGFYGTHLHKDLEHDVIVLSFSLLLAMGIQNSAVNTISEGRIKTSHLTGLFTDLGAEISEWLHPKMPRSSILEQKILLRTSIFLFYIMGGISGGWLFIKTKFLSFLFIAMILACILVYDLMKFWWEGSRKTMVS